MQIWVICTLIMIIAKGFINLIQIMYGEFPYTVSRTMITALMFFRLAWFIWGIIAIFA